METLSGGNITDISQYDGVRLISKYWASVCKSGKFEEFGVQKVSSSAERIVFVGDVHGDLNQFIAPLVLNNLITLTGEVEERKIKSLISDDHSVLVLPKYTIHDNVNVKVVYLGDLIDEWIFSRQVVVMLYDLLKNAKNHVFYIYGNHDLAVIGRYHLFCSKSLNLALDIPALWQTLKKELNHIKNLKIYKTVAELDGEPVKGFNYINNYVSPIFEYLFKIFESNFGAISLAIKIQNKNFMISHTTWTTNALQQLLSTHEEVKSSPDARPSDTNPEQLKPLIPSHTPNTDDIEIINSIISSQQPHESIDYAKLSNAVNSVFRSKSRLFICKNFLTYTRITKTIFLNHIIGHSSGAEFRDQNVNSTPSTYFNERQSKLSPTFFNGRTVYYFDFGCSAGYDHDEIGRPDFVYSTPNGLYVSNLPAFSFINSNGKDSLLVMKDKTPRTSNKIIFNDSN